jgi:hypothetical protein
MEKTNYQIVNQTQFEFKNIKKTFSKGRKCVLRRKYEKSKKIIQLIKHLRPIPLYRSSVSDQKEERQIKLQKAYIKEQNKMFKLYYSEYISRRTEINSLFYVYNNGKSWICLIPEDVIRYIATFI